MSCRRITLRAWWRPESWLLTCCLAVQPTVAIALQYHEEFDTPGRPIAPPGIEWDYRDELSPVEDWTGLIPGDGYAYLSAERELLKKSRYPWSVWPFQEMSFGPITANHRISLRAKNTAIPGLAAMIFTYREQDTIDEIDIEIVARDTESARPQHKTGPDGGWTDVRLVTWIEADRHKPEPKTLVKSPILDADGNKVSHRDDQFHIYTIEWSPHEVRFLIDGVLQKSIPDAVTDRPTRVIFGLRQMPWAGRPDWEGYQTMLVDWVRIEPLDHPPARQGDE
jgi:hypothetical protein